MRRRAALAVATGLSTAAAGAAALGVAAAPVGAAATPRLHECQHPVRTGVEVYNLNRVGSVTACPVALALFAWEAKSGNPARLYGCHRPNPNAAGYPYLRLRSFDGWALSLRGRPYGAFTMSRGAASFAVTGTDFPLNCS